MPQKCFLHTYCFVTQSNKKKCIQGLQFNKVNYFYCFIKDILRWKRIFLNRVAVKNTMIHVQLAGGVSLNCANTAVVLLPLILNQQCKCQHAKKANDLLQSLWKLCGPHRSPGKVSGTLLVFCGLHFDHHCFQVLHF